MANGKEEKAAPEVIEFPNPAVPMRPVARSWVPVAATVGSLGVLGGLGYLGYRLWEGRADEPSPEPKSEPAKPSEPPSEPTKPSETPNPGVVPPDFWGDTEKGAQYRALLKRIEEVSRMPIRLFLSVVANRESDWSRTARNKSKQEVDNGSKLAITNGVKRGNPKPKYADSLALAGSGGLCGALAPYVAWTGMDENYMPYLDMDWNVIEDPVTAVICAAKYYQRIVANYDNVFAGVSPMAEDNFRVRLGWASPQTLKEDPGGKLFKDVRGRMEEDLKELGLKITDLPPPDASKWPGLKAVYEAMKSFTPTWK